LVVGAASDDLFGETHHLSIGLVCNAARLEAGRSTNRTNLTGALCRHSASASGTTSANLTNHSRGAANATTQDEGRNLLNGHREKQTGIAGERTECSASLSGKAPFLSFLHGVSKSAPLVTKLGRHEFCPELSATTAKPRQDIVVASKAKDTTQTAKAGSNATSTRNNRATHISGTGTDGAEKPTLRDGFHLAWCRRLLRYASPARKNVTLDSLDDLLVRHGVGKLDRPNARDINGTH
jgi:hypothetical protein